MQANGKETNMKRHIVIAATAIFYLCSSTVPAQQPQQAPPEQSGAAGTAAAPGAPGTTGGGAAGTSGAPGAAGTSGASGQPPGPVAGRAVLGVTIVEMDAIILGWSAKKDLLGKAVMNDAKEKIGEIEDIIITPDNSASYAIIGVGGFLGLGERRVSIPFQQIRMKDTSLILPGATKEALKALPEFKYAPRKR
jgi:sporulation protein YlmC with PRC-barrel domain